MSSKNDIENDIEINDIEIIIDNGTLTNQQKTIVLKIYNKVKNNVSEIINKLSNDNLEVSDVASIIFELVCYNMKIIEKIKVNRTKLTGEEKKLIVLELIRVSIHSEVKDEIVKTTILKVYEMSAESILENVLDVSQSVNTGIKKGCNTLFKCCRN